MAGASARASEAGEEFIGAGWPAPREPTQPTSDGDPDPMERYSITSIAGAPASPARPAPPPGRSDSASDLRGMAGSGSGPGPLRRVPSSVSVADSALEYDAADGTGTPRRLALVTPSGPSITDSARGYAGIRGAAAAERTASITDSAIEYGAAEDTGALRQLSDGALVAPSGASISDSARGYVGGNHGVAVAARTASVADSALEYSGRVAPAHHFAGGALASVRNDSAAESTLEYEGNDITQEDHGYGGGSNANLGRLSGDGSGTGSINDSANEAPGAREMRGEAIIERSDSVESWPRARPSRHSSREHLDSGLLDDALRSRSALLDSAGDAMPWLPGSWGGGGGGYIGECGHAWCFQHFTPAL